MPPIPKVYIATQSLLILLHIYPLISVALG